MNPLLTNLNSTNSNDFRIAVTYCYEQLKDKLLKYLYSRGAGSQAEDILQEVFLILVNRQNKTSFTLENGQASIKNYLYKIATQQLGKVKTNSLKTIKSHQEAHFIRYSLISPFKEENYNRLQQTIANTLNEKEKYLFHLIINQEKRAIDIAAEFEVPPVNIRVQWLRLKRRLQENAEINRSYVNIF